MGAKNTKGNNGTRTTKTLDAIEFDFAPELADDDGYTIKELCESTGMSNNMMRELMRKAIDAGVWECSGRKRIKAIDGRIRHSPSYRKVKKQKKN